MARQNWQVGTCCRPQEGLFGLREWEEKSFVPEAVPTGLPCPSGSALIQQKRVRGSSSRVPLFLACTAHLITSCSQWCAAQVIKKPNRFAQSGFQDLAEEGYVAASGSTVII